MQGGNTPDAEEHDAVIIGAGAAGASCALWLTLMGLRCLLVDGASAPGGLLLRSPYDNPWIAIAPPGITGCELAGNIAAALEQARVAARYGDAVHEISADAGGFTVRLASGAEIRARHAVLATGVTPATGGLSAAEGVLFGPGPHVLNCDFRGRSVAILGGGDNAFEHALILRERGVGQVHLFARSVRARRAFLEQIDPADVTPGEAAVDTERRTVNGRPFDLILVMYGFQPRLPLMRGCAPALDPHGHVQVDDRCATNHPGLYAIGELTGRMHPAVVTALADGVVAAKAIQTRIEDGAAAAFLARLGAQTKP